MTPVYPLPAAEVPAYDPELSDDENAEWILSHMPETVRYTLDKDPVEYDAQVEWNRPTAAAFTVGATFTHIGKPIPTGLPFLYEVAQFTSDARIEVRVINKPRPEPIAVNFDLNYADAPAPTAVLADDEGKVTPPENPIREGYTFMGWFDNAEASGDKIDFETARFSEATTVYAGWRGPTPLLSVLQPTNHSTHTKDSMTVIGAIFGVNAKPTKVTLSLSNAITDEVIQSIDVEPEFKILNIPEVYSGPGYLVATEFKDIPDGLYDVRFAAVVENAEDSVLSRNQLVDTTPPKFEISADEFELVEDPNMRTIRVVSYEDKVDLQMQASDDSGVEINLSNMIGSVKYDEVGSSYEGFLDLSYTYPRATKLSMGENIAYFRAIDGVGHITVHKVIIDRRAKVLFDLNYPDAPEAIGVGADADGKVVPPEVTREGFTLTGWYDNPESEGEAIDFETAVFDQDATVYAEWIKTPEIWIESPAENASLTGESFEFLGWINYVTLEPFVNVSLYRAEDNALIAKVENPEIELVDAETGLYKVVTSFEMPDNGDYKIVLSAYASDPATDRAAGFSLFATEPSTLLPIFASNQFAVNNPVEETTEPETTEPETTEPETTEPKKHDTKTPPKKKLPETGMGTSTSMLIGAISLLGASYYTFKRKNNK